MKSKLNINADKKYFELVDLLKSNEDRDCIYADAVCKERKKALEKKYGKKTETCFCRLFRKRCDRRNGPCEFKELGAGLWRDKGKMFYDGQEYTFVSEPYEISNKSLQEIMYLSDKYNLEIQIDARVASEFPSHTFAIIIKKRK